MFPNALCKCFVASCAAAVGLASCGSPIPNSTLPCGLLERFFDEVLMTEMPRSGSVVVLQPNTCGACSLTAMDSLAAVTSRGSSVVIASDSIPEYFRERLVRPSDTHIVSIDDLTRYGIQRAYDSYFVIQEGAVVDCIEIKP